jgi:hypothetical protein
VPAREALDKFIPHMEKLFRVAAEQYREAVQAKERHRGFLKTDSC